MSHSTLHLSSAVLVSVLNMIYAAIIYLSLHGWLVAHEPSGMQLLVHLIITAPTVVVTTIWLYLIHKDGGSGGKLWKVNLTGLLVPVMSMQMGVTYYHFDKVGLGVALLTALALVILFVSELHHRVRIPQQHRKP